MSFWLMLTRTRFVSSSIPFLGLACYVKFLLIKTLSLYDHNIIKSPGDFMDYLLRSFPFIISGCWQKLISIKLVALGLESPIWLGMNERSQFCERSGIASWKVDFWELIHERKERTRKGSIDFWSLINKIKFLRVFDIPDSWWGPEMCNCHYQSNKSI